MSDDTFELPEDLREQMQLDADNHDKYTPGTNPYRVLLAKYTPKPKTLDPANVRWTRYYDEPAKRLIEANQPLGLTAVNSSERLPWPEVEGIDPTGMLNAGWQVRSFRDVPPEWDVRFAIGLTSKEHHLVEADHPVPRESGVLVFCRPSEGDDQ